MKYENGKLAYSATDLAHHLSCHHLTELELRAAKGTIKREHYHDAVLELLLELGQRHETAYLDLLTGEGRSVVEIEEFGGQQSIDQTIKAMRSGVDVVAQASLADWPWRGRADFLIKVDRPSQLGNWSYEVADTKLAQTTRAGTVLQLCLYTELVEAIQGLLPAQMFVVRPGDPFAVESLRVADFAAYFRMVKADFVSHIEASPHGASYPVPNPHCQNCDWWRNCNQRWREDDHLNFVAGIGRSQIAELSSHNVITLQAFAGANTPLPAPPKRGSMETFEKLHRQAQIQVEGRSTGRPKYAFNDVVEHRGFLQLPEPCEGDVFFDIEGYPRAIGESLEYLLGYVTADKGGATYHRSWGLSKPEERQAFATFMDFVTDRWERWPNMHIYHFAHYEPSALKRLATRHAIREVELDQLLRGKRLVDLYATTRQAIRASVESYSIKELEQLYGFERKQKLPDASRFLRSVERMIELDLTAQITSEHRDVIERYNKDDCLSTLALREWLESLRCELESTGQELQRPQFEEGDANETIQQTEAEMQAVFDQLVADTGAKPTGEHQSARWLLAHMLGYFRREEKSAAWEYFRLRKLEHEELLRERKAVTGLEFQAALDDPAANSTIHRYRFAPQEVTISIGQTLHEVRGNKIGSVAGINHQDCNLDIKKIRNAVDQHPSAVFENEYFPLGSLPGSMLQFGIQIAERQLRSGRYDLLAHRPPKFHTLALPMDGDQKEIAIMLARDMDNSYLPIQGPPGSGKTHIGSHMIAALARDGNRIGVTAVSHPVTLNLLRAVLGNAEPIGGVLCAHHRRSQSENWPADVGYLPSRDRSLQALDDGIVVGGTAWLWSHPELESQLDYLFIDEAGQMSLAMALAAARAARNIVLLGDPQQLEQPQQGSHPEGSGVAALDHVLNGAPTMPAHMGLFLEHTWRLHPSICDFTSEQYYDGRLHSLEGLEKQEVLGESPFIGGGLRFVPVNHTENQNRSFEEVEVVSGLLNQILDGKHLWRDQAGKDYVVSIRDVMVIAPYNAQVASLVDALPDGTRVGTVDKFQGQEAPIVIYSMTSSSAVDAPRGISFLFSRNRMNVATSRARCLAILVGSPNLFIAYCDTPKQMRLVNGFCRFEELATTIRIQNQ